MVGHRKTTLVVAGGAAAACGLLVLSCRVSAQVPGNDMTCADKRELCASNCSKYFSALATAENLATCYAGCVTAQESCMDNPKTLAFIDGGNCVQTCKRSYKNSLSTCDQSVFDLDHTHGTHLDVCGRTASETMEICMQGCFSTDGSNPWMPINEEGKIPNETDLTGVILKPYSSFASYAWEMSKGVERLPLPIAVPIGGTSPMSIPLVIIIGAQKGGTTNLRWNLLNHPMVTGMPDEVHFFDIGIGTYPGCGEWPGDGLERPLHPETTGVIYSEYAKRCLEKGKPKATTIHDDKVLAMTRGVLVDSSPEYLLSPLAPYRMKMVLPYSKFVVVLRDPTDRYFSQLRMVMCKAMDERTHKSVEQLVIRLFHQPGEAEDYLRRGKEAYEPYTALCRGENATAMDLWDCYSRKHNPLHRGLYADQLETWFRVYDRSQIMVINSVDMFTDFTTTVAKVAEWVGLPEHKFEYIENRGGSGYCGKRKPPDFFVNGGRYELMLAEEQLFREWYRPHTERLEVLLGRGMNW